MAITKTDKFVESLRVEDDGSVTAVVFYKLTENGKVIGSNREKVAVNASSSEKATMGSLRGKAANV